MGPSGYKSAEHQCLNSINRPPKNNLSNQEEEITEHFLCRPFFYNTQFSIWQRCDSC